ncbi:MAG: Dps family protein [Pseudomonadota bacterium]|nr:Dps family protein [Pseudomonadota bacterium]
MKIDTGLNKDDRQKIADAMACVLADSYSLYVKTHNVHWNVTGPMFNAVHTMTEVQYTELAIAVDDIAERIRALGHFAPGSYSKFAKLSEIKDLTDTPPAEDMVAILVKDHETVIKTCRAAIALAQEAADEVTAGLLTDRITIHEKTAWMLRSLVS